MATESVLPRRCYIDRLTPAETAIREAILAVEALPADTRLTEAVVLLQQAKNKVADYVDNEKVPERFRKALEAVAGWKSVNLSAEPETELRKIIDSMADCAIAALE